MIELLVAGIAATVGIAVCHFLVVIIAASGDVLANDAQNWLSFTIAPGAEGVIDGDHQLVDVLGLAFGCYQQLFGLRVCTDVKAILAGLVQELGDFRMILTAAAASFKFDSAKLALDCDCHFDFLCCVFIF